MTIPRPVPQSPVPNAAAASCRPAPAPEGAAGTGAARPGVFATGASAAALTRFLGELRAGITVYAAARRAEGVPSARVLAELRCLLREAESCEGWQDAASSDLLLAQITRWTLEAYHHDGHDTRPPRSTDGATRGD